MRKLILAAAAFAAIATPASAGYYGGYGHSYYAPRVVCHFVQVPVYGYYGVHYVTKKVCKTVY
jgi:hypothetical protein